MPAPRKYDQETRDRAVRMYQDRRRDFPGESMLAGPPAGRRAVGRQARDAARAGSSGREIDAGQRPGVPTLGRGSDQGAGAGERRAAPGERDPQDRVGVFRPGGARPPTAVIVDYIDAYRDRFGVEPICRVLSRARRADRPEHLSTPTRPSPVSDADWDDAHMANAALDLWRANRSLYGADKLATAMRKAGHDVGRDQVARLMRILGIEGVRRGKHRTVTTRRDPAAARHPDLINRAWNDADPAGPVVGRRLHLRVDPGRVRLRRASSPTCAPGGSSAGGSRCPRRPRWSCPRSNRRCSPAAATTPASPPRGSCSTPTRGSQGGIKWSSQHLERGGGAMGVERASAGDPGDARSDAVAGSAAGCAA